MKFHLYLKNQKINMLQCLKKLKQCLEKGNNNIATTINKLTGRKKKTYEMHLCASSAFGLIGGRKNTSPMTVSAFGTTFLEQLTP